MSSCALILFVMNISLSYFATRDNLRNDCETKMQLSARQIVITVKQLQDKRPEEIPLPLLTGFLNDTMLSNQSYLEITGINPVLFGDKHHSGPSSMPDTLPSPWMDRPIVFGTYYYNNQSEDSKAVHKAFTSEKSVFMDTELNGQHILQIFVPVVEDDWNSYVIRIVSSYDHIESILWKQLVRDISISFLLFEMVLISSYYCAGWFTRPLKDMILKLDEISEGKLETRLNVSHQDELGILGQRINKMAANLSAYTEELQQMSDKNRLTSEYFESIINQTADAVHLTDEEGRVIRVNHAFEKLYGWGNEEAKGKLLNLIPEYLQMQDALGQQKLHKGLPVVSDETVRLCKDGNEIDVSISQSPIFNDNGEFTGTIVISRDMTEHHLMEDLLRRSEKLTTVGQLAAGVAHEIRNPLTTLRGFLQIQQESEKVNIRHTEIMLSELDRINLIVSEFLILAKPQVVHFQVKDLRFIMGDVVSLLDSQAHLFNIEFTVRFSKDPILVYCEENQLKQVFINLLKNAIEAMKNGGIITLDLHSRHQYAIIRIIDEGEGIAEGTLQKLGEPFFTSKDTGTGLGLMVSQRIIESHKGTMKITSYVGEGTEVAISLPLLKKDDDVAKQLEQDERGEML